MAAFEATPVITLVSRRAQASKLAQDLLSKRPSGLRPTEFGPKIYGYSGHGGTAGGRSRFVSGCASYWVPNYAPPMAPSNLSAGETEGETPLPTTLPHRPRADVKRSPRRVVFDILFNGAMLVSALALTFVVLMREQRYAYGQQEIADQTMQQRMLDGAGETRVTPPLD
jgi:hypothetical protein